MSSAQPAADSKFYRRRDPEASAFYKLVTGYFDKFEREYPHRYGMRFGLSFHS